ncbi:MAG: elongation factor Ts [Gammaproteobacteria bacterium]|nr:MAG: elongation factor Ts [Gammaproteobacteria bacterium]
MVITAAMVKELRERTSVGMMECKKALVEADGDMDAAVKLLRKSGLAGADKKAGRVAAEGVIALAVSDDGKRAVMAEINSETDFVARDGDFRSFADGVARVVLDSRPGDLDALLAAPMEGGESVEEARQALVARLGENIQVRRFTTMESSGDIGAYSHGGKIGVLVSLNGGNAELAKDIAMHVAAMNPLYVSPDDVPVAEVEKEREILIAQARDSGKPDNIIEKMVEGRLRKFLNENALLGQPFVKDTDITVGKLVEKDGAVVEGMYRLALGEGIEKKADNFAEEVMAQARGG